MGARHRVRLAGVPALTRHQSGTGTAWYLATRVDAAATAALVRELCDEAGVQVHDHPGVEVVRRDGDQASYVFVINHTDAPASIPADGTDLVSGRRAQRSVDVPAGGVAVIREETG